MVMMTEASMLRPCLPTGAVQGMLQHLHMGEDCGCDHAVAAVVAAEDADTMDLEPWVMSGTALSTAHHLMTSIGLCKALR